MGMPGVYESRAEEFFSRYEAIDAADIRALLKRWVPQNARVIELGCGSGRDARFMKSLGARVTALDGSPTMIRLAREKEAHETGTPGSPIDWHVLEIPPVPGAALPFEGSADVVFSSGLLQHLDDHELYEAAAFIDGVTNRRGAVVLCVPLNHPGDKDRPTHHRDALDYITLFERMGFRKAYLDIKNTVGAPGYECRWASFVFLRAEESDRALKRFRTIIEHDAKVATYKLALLRTLCSINLTMPRAVRFENNRAILPLGLIIEKWIEFFWQLSKDGRAPRQIQGSRSLGFSKSLARVQTLCNRQFSVFTELLDSRLSRSRETDLLIGRLFQDVRKTVLIGPVTHITDEESNQIFQGLSPRRRIPLTDRISLHERYGELAFPAELWLELTRIAPWLEDSVVLEWARLSARFEELSAVEGNPMTLPVILSKLLPEKAERDTKVARDFYLRCLTHGELSCVWTRRKLNETTLAVDHLLPWAKLHNNHLWNLVPADKRVNGSKSDRIPSADLLWSSRHAIIGCWSALQQYRPEQFLSEARIALLPAQSSLPETRWESILFDALLDTADMVSRQLQAQRWNIRS